MAIQCPTCHSENSEASRFCADCGAQLPLSQDLPPVVTETLQTSVQGLTKGSLIAGKYKIIGEIGRGGMGIVYKAEDIKLRRSVALKFLPRQWVSDPDARERFIQEARAASALDHPNIYTIYEIAEDDRLYIAMAFYEGESLRDRIKRGPLAQEAALGIAIQAATGMVKAHQKGIVHRDIKPANILITIEDVAKVVDFGLAKLAGQAKVTREGTTVGTVAYMSPEQAKGEAVDQRTDIWSLGVVLYEMLTGELPFKGEHTQGLIYSILNKTPVLPITLRPDIPKHIEDAIFKALEKDPSRRYQKMEELIEDLKQPRPSVFSKTEKSIVVLPFENLSADPEQEYFCDGMTEEIITDLSAVNSIRVISRSSAMTFKATRKKVSEIARDVNVRYVLEGSVRKAGNKLRIVAQLIDSATDAHLWAEKYSGTLDDVFDIQENVSRSIVEALRLQLTQKEGQRLAERPIPNALAYEFYLKARLEIMKWTEAGLDNALRYLRTGLEIVGNNALLYAGMAYVFCQYINLGIKEEEYCRKEADSFIQKAFALDPQSSYSHFVRGLLLAPDKPREAVRHFKRALEKNPSDFDTLYFLACLLGTLGQGSAALPLEERLIRIDPLNSAAYLHSGFNRIWEGKFALALEALGKLHQSFPEDVGIKWSYGLSLAYMDRKGEAGLVFDQIAREQPGGIFEGLGLALKNALEGKKSEAMRCLDSNAQLQKTRDFQYAFWIAECYALIGEKGRALDWLERDVASGMINYPLMNEYDPFLANIRGDPRFKKLMERVKTEWEHFEE